MESRTLRCLVERRGENWEAICLDFDVAVQGHSFEEVRASLREAVVLYLEEVMSLPEAERNHLLYRAAPLSLRLKFLWAFIVAAIRSSLGDGDDNHDYPYTMPSDHLAAAA